MNLVQVSSYFPPHLGGIEYVSREMSSRLSERGYIVKVFTSDIGCEVRKIKSSKNLKINYLRSFEFAHTPIIPSLIFKLLKLSSNCLIHVHAGQAGISELVWLASKIKNFKYIVHMHGEVKPTGKLGFLLRPYQKYIQKISMNGASKVIVLNDYYKKFFGDKYNLKNIEVLPNGVKDEYFIKSISKNKNLELIYVGRLNAEKNIDVLIKAVSLLKNKTVFNIVGDGEKMKELENLVKKLKLKNVIFHGRKEGKDLINLYKKADISLLASNSEGLPTFLLESMACGKPIIGSNVQGIKDLISGIGVLVSPPNAENFAKEIDRLVENPKLRRELSLRGIKKAKQYNWDNVIDKLESIYEEVLKQNDHKQK